MSLRVLAAPDKFRGSASAAEVADAIAAGAERLGLPCRRLPLADGGEGTLEALGGPNRATRVAGPLGAPVDAAWRLSEGVAVVETARASGLALVGGREQNDPLAASTRGTGELIGEAIEAGATRIVVGVGGSATTDGGLGAVEALGWMPFGARGATVEVACDVRTSFLDAARVFGPQKGASGEDVEQLTARLRALAGRYRDELGLDVTGLPGGGAAGGLAGGLAALGAALAPGLDLVAEAVGLAAALGGADAVVTGEGLLDATSLQGKVVGGVLDRAARAGVHAAVIVGEQRIDAPPGVEVVSLVERFGRERSWEETLACVADAAAELLRRRL